MSDVVKSKRNVNKEYQVTSFMYKLRKNIISQLLIDFGYSEIKEEKKIQKLKNDNPNMNPAKLQERIDKNIGFQVWFISDERIAIVKLLRKIVGKVTEANSIFPTTAKEYKSRIKSYNKAISNLYKLTQELQFVIETLPVDINKYISFARDIDHEIELIKGAKKSDKKRFKKIVLNNDAQDEAALYAKIQKILSEQQIESN